MRSGLIDVEGIVADCKSGVSGAGRCRRSRRTSSEVNESFKAYKVASHRHNPEMEAYLGREAGQPRSLTFVPHLVPMTRGMLATIYARLAVGVEPVQTVQECLSAFYADRPFVRLRPAGVPPTHATCGARTLRHRRRGGGRSPPSG